MDSRSGKKRALDRLRQQIISGERGGCPRDRLALIVFEEGLKTRDRSVSRREKLLRHCTIMAEHGPGRLVDVLEGDGQSLPAKEAAKAFKGWIDKAFHPDHGTRGTSWETNQDYRTALRRFPQDILFLDEAPSAVSWISKSRDNAPAYRHPDSHPTWEHAVAMSRKARNPRDRALVLVQAETGMRGLGEGGELQELQVGDMERIAAGYKIRLPLPGKNTPPRTVFVLRQETVAALDDWLDEHPAPEDPDAPLWSCLQGATLRSNLNAVFQDLADRADIPDEVDTTPTGFRAAKKDWFEKHKMGGNFLHTWFGRKFDPSDSDTSYSSYLRQEDLLERYRGLLEDEGIRRAGTGADELWEETEAVEDQLDKLREDLYNEIHDEVEKRVARLAGHIAAAEANIGGQTRVVGRYYIHEPGRVEVGDRIEGVTVDGVDGS